MALAKQLVQFFFGASDQDSSAKGVKLGDLTLARNVHQPHMGEHVKRGGFTHRVETYTGASSVTPDGVTSPDGTVILVRDTKPGTVYARSGTGASTTRGGSQRLTAKSRLRFPSTTSGTQTAPMLKQAGNWFVWLDDENHFRVAKQATDGTKLEHISDPITVAGPTDGSGTSRNVKSFAVLFDPVFDAAHVWVYWVDWTTNAGTQQNRDSVWAMKIAIADGTTTQMVVEYGSVSNLYILTGISATSVSGIVYLSQCGIHLSTGSAVDFRSSSFGVADGYAQHFQVDNTGTLVGAVHAYVHASTARSWVASGICWLTSTEYAYSAGHMYYAFWTKHATSHTLADLVLVDVTTSTGATTGHTIETINLASAILPAVMSANHTFVGQVTGRETATGVAVVSSLRVSAPNSGSQVWADIQANAPDRIFTMRTDWTGIGGGTKSTIWTKRGAWLAHGLFTRSDGEEFLITGYHDSDEAQLPYHLRRFSDGGIVCQFGYGEGAFAGGCGASAGQLDKHISDIQQPYLAVVPYADTYPGVVLPMTSANVSGSVDMAAIDVALPSYQSSATARGLMVSPGGIPTIAGGWQNVQEAGPLVYPADVDSFWGTGSS